MKNDEVGVRELRQNLSKYLRKIEQGKTLRVLDRGTPVAVLAPLPAENGILSQLVRAGLAAPPRHAPSTLPRPVPAARGGKTVTEALREERAERLK